MRAAVLIVVLALCLDNCDRGQREADPSASSTRKAGDRQPLVTTPSQIDFATRVRPILQARCQPCHFAGGKMYERLPFDRLETIRTLGTKLFSRIEDEKERQVIREFLAQR
jgi:hypothetical protein